MISYQRYFLTQTTELIDTQRLISWSRISDAKNVNLYIFDISEEEFVLILKATQDNLLSTLINHRW